MAKSRIVSIINNNYDNDWQQHYNYTVFTVFHRERFEGKVGPREFMHKSCPKLTLST